MDSLDNVSTDQIGAGLTQAYKELDDEFCSQTDEHGSSLEDGTTAVTTVYDGKGNLVTALLADAAAFAAMYDKEGNILRVVRFNSITHKPTNNQEEERIIAAGGCVILGRVNGSLAVSRAIEGIIRSQY